MTQTPADEERAAGLSGAGARMQAPRAARAIPIELLDAPCHPARGVRVFMQ
ncbi:hypothetical protein LYSHEL_08870 [Lysobacter helvus]|uniref:Uncharacterized protein n=2 Tax=Lysobacteraceae TaxID=32033 RepID=A0ABN6FQK1_9GAMM|nr:hypothetical protein LYSCAS_08870 [Lysobacter caseinilyticus]BCT95016.1 hypothetical protein LYSHEL_08870 [Lysobacter helvus]